LKPAFTDSNLNDIASRVINDDGGDPQAGAVAGMARSDWRRALMHAFHLTPVQQRNLANIPSDRVAAIQAAVVSALDTNGTIDASFGSNGSLVVGRGGGTGPSPDLKIVILKCTFDANCSNWNCGLANPLE
jgi:hypothetical protein